MIPLGAGHVGKGIKPTWEIRVTVGRRYAGRWTTSIRIGRRSRHLAATRCGSSSASVYRAEAWNGPSRWGCRPDAAMGFAMILGRRMRRSGRSVRATVITAWPISSARLAWRKEARRHGLQRLHSGGRWSGAGVTLTIGSLTSTGGVWPGFVVEGDRRRLQARVSFRTVEWSSEQLGNDLRSETAGDVGGPAVRRELRHPVERTAVDQRDFDAVARMRSNLKAQALVVVRMVEQGSGDRRCRAARRSGRRAAFSSVASVRARLGIGSVLLEAHPAPGA